MFGLELHPAVIHFPIALGVVGALAAIVYLFLRKEWLRWFAPILLSMALLGAVAGYFSGQSAEDRAEALKVPEAAIEEHEESAIWAMGLIGLAALLSWATHARRRGEWVSALIAAVAAAAVLRTGHLGGILVFVHGAGHVKASAVSGAVPGAGAGESGEKGEKGGGDRD
ncbi:MAG TPA: DUF2231 domain-containing protein [Candidatus Eisenbacteria bacterium]|nr:DUF2231 domain-containing protein [Candidatus Eisenbacteria bacterium]